MGSSPALPQQSPGRAGGRRAQGVGAVGAGPPGQLGSTWGARPWAAASGAPLTGSRGLRVLWGGWPQLTGLSVCLSAPGSPAAPVQLWALQERRHV